MIVLFVLDVSDSKISLFVSSINNIPKKNGMNSLIKFLLLWKKMVYYEIFSHENSIHFILMILWLT